MGFYSDVVLPRLCDLAMRNRHLLPYRKRVVGSARPSAALHEMRRVLKPSGRLVFVEHGLSSEESVQRWQDRLTPLWRRITSGCHLNRSIRAVIEDSGFGLERLETGYMPGLKKIMNFTYEGSALPR